MRLLIHQFKKDLRETWGLWLLWAFFTLLQFALAAWPIHPGEGASRTYAQIAAMVPTINSLLLLVLVPALILQEPTVGTSAFWLTRPMPRGVVLGSKLIALAILLVLPLLGQCAVFAAHGLLPGDVVLAGLQIALGQLSWLSLAAALAVLSPGFGRFVVVAVVFFTLQYFSGWLFNWWAQFHMRPVTPGDAVPVTLNISQGIVCDLLRIAFCLGIFTFQYLTRRTRHSLIAASVGIAALWATPHLWTWDFLRIHNEPPQAAALDPDSISFQLGGNHNLYEQNDGTGSMQKYMQSTLQVSGLPPRYALAVTSHGGLLALPDGTTLPLSMPLTSLGARQSPSNIEEALGNIPFLNVDPFTGFSDSDDISVALYGLPSSTFAARSQAQGTATFTLKVVPKTYRVAHEIPFKQGAGFTEGSDRTTIASILKNSNGFDIELESRVVVLQLRPSTLSHPWRWSFYALVNRKRGEALYFSEAQRNSFVETRASIFNSLTANVLSFLPQSPAIEQTLSRPYGSTLISQNGPSDRIQLHFIVPIDDAWLADATLVRIEEVDAPSFEKTLVVPDYAIDGHTLPTWDQMRRKRNDTTPPLPPLADNPSRAEAWSYIRALNRSERYVDSLSENDPQIDLFRKVGTANADLLLIAMGQNFNDWHLVRAFNGIDFSQNPNSEAKAMAFRSLSTHPDLIEAIQNNHWAKEAEPYLIELLGHAKIDSRQYAYRQDAQNKWAQATASLRDPATYDTLFTWTETRDLENKTYVNSEFHTRLYRNLRPLPGPLVQASVKRLWDQKKGTDRETDFLATAAEWGVPDVLGRSAEILAAPLPADKTAGDKAELAKGQARAVFQNRTACPGNLLDSALAAWYAANKDRLAFDIRLGRFLVNADNAGIAPDAAWNRAEDTLRDLGIRAAQGDASALDEIDALLARVGAGIDPVADPKRLENLTNVAWNAMGPLRDGAREHPEIVLPILREMNKKERLRRFAANGYKLAAGDGNAEAVDTLLRYQENGWTINATIDSLWEAVQKGSPKAVDFVAAVLADPAKKKFWNQAGSCLKDLANAGNPKAKAAYEAWQKAKSPND